MQNTSTSRSTDFRRQKTITSKTPLTLYWRGFCASDGTPTTTGSPAGPQSNQNVWVLPPISRNDGETSTLCRPEVSASSSVSSAPRVAYRRLPGCVVMGINRTRRLFGRQKKDAWAASQCTLYGFRPRCNHFLSPPFLFFSLWSRKLHFRYAHRYFLDIYDTLKQSKELSRRGF